MTALCVAVAVTGPAARTATGPAEIAAPRRPVEHRRWPGRHGLHRPTERHPHASRPDRASNHTDSSCRDAGVGGEAHALDIGEIEVDVLVNPSRTLW